MLLDLINLICNLVMHMTTLYIVNECESHTKNYPIILLGTYLFETLINNHYQTSEITQLMFLVSAEHLQTMITRDTSTMSVLNPSCNIRV